MEEAFIWLMDTRFIEFKRVQGVFTDKYFKKNLSHIQNYPEGKTLIKAKYMYHGHTCG